MEHPSLSDLQLWCNWGMVKAHGGILSRRRKGFKRQKQKNLEEEHSEKPNQGRTMWAQLHAQSLLLLLVFGSPSWHEARPRVGNTGPGSGQPAPLAGEIYHLAELVREGACKDPGHEKRPSVSGGATVPKAGASIWPLCVVHLSPWSLGPGWPPFCHL